MNRWAAIDVAGNILGVGADHRRFSPDQIIFMHGCVGGCINAWENDGRRYVNLFEGNFVRILSRGPSQNISNYSHGRVRRYKRLKRGSVL